MIISYTVKTAKTVKEFKPELLWALTEGQDMWRLKGAVYETKEMERRMEKYLVINTAFTKLCGLVLFSSTLIRLSISFVS